MLKTFGSIRNLSYDRIKVHNKHHATSASRKFMSPLDLMMTNHYSNQHETRGVIQEEFNLFTHEKLLKSGKPLDFSYEALRIAILELYLSVKIRSDQEIDAYEEADFHREKA